MRERGTAKTLESQFRMRSLTTPILPTGQHMQMLPWQMYALHVITQTQCGHGSTILEIGTGFGTSAWMMAKASQLAKITTITNNSKEAVMARAFLAGSKTVTVVESDSLAYFEQGRTARWDMIYLDADHKHCMDDLHWFNRLRVGGLMMFHDYSPNICPPVFEAIGALGEALGRSPDIDLIDSGGIGMAGFHRKRGDLWPE